MKRWVLISVCFTFFAFGNEHPKVESFVIQIKDRNIVVLSPEKRKELFSVIVENQSLSDQVAKFTINEKLVRYISIKQGKTESVEIENKSASNIYFVPVSPSFQEAELVFGKKAYEIPSKE